MKPQDKENLLTPPPTDAPKGLSTCRIIVIIVIIAQLLIISFLTFYLIRLAINTTGVITVGPQMEIVPRDQPDCDPPAFSLKATGKCYKFYKNSENLKRSQEYCSWGGMAKFENPAEAAVLIGKYYSFEHNWTSITPLRTINNGMEEEKMMFFCVDRPWRIAAERLHDGFGKCPEDFIWFENTGYCYKSFNTPTTLKEAEKTCESIGSHLTTSESPMENMFLMGLQANFTLNKGTDGSFWLNMKFNFKQGRWEDCCGKPVWSANFDRKIMKYKGHVTVDLRGGKWRSGVEKDEMHPFVCRRDSF